MKNLEVGMVQVENQVLQKQLDENQHFLNQQQEKIDKLTKLFSVSSQLQDTEKAKELKVGTSTKKTVLQF